jgi:hypothetical protein
LVISGKLKLTLIFSLYQSIKNAEVRAKEPFEKIVKGKVQAPAKVNRTD